MDFVKRALDNDLLVINEENITPAFFNETGNMRMEAVIEPVKGLLISLNMIYEDNRRTELQYMVDGMPVIRGGSFAMSTVAISNYGTQAFNKFMQNRRLLQPEFMGNIAI